MASLVRWLGWLLLAAALGNWLFYFEGEEGYTLGTSLVVTAIMVPIGLGLIVWSRQR